MIDYKLEDCKLFINGELMMTGKAVKYRVVTPLHESYVLCIDIPNNRETNLVRFVHIEQGIHYATCTYWKGNNVIILCSKHMDETEINKFITEYPCINEQLNLNIHYTSTYDVLGRFRDFIYQHP